MFWGKFNQRNNDTLIYKIIDTYNLIIPFGNTKYLNELYNVSYHVNHVPTSRKRTSESVPPTSETAIYSVICIVWSVCGILRPAEKLT
ncbi:unnamed protein product [Onchocerca flexuosa]|uniref:Ovule protein n=1 Tax=Onchocerca flexuosa TaxID=387005 RepID=A0A183HKZ7_9BILA|nr:unnamed protein product [Onchocerca flexuosa]